MQIDIPIYHVHTLNKAAIQKSVELCLEKGIIPSGRKVGALIHSYKIAQHKPLFIISSVRDPISRNISAFFDAFRFLVGVKPKNWKGSIEDLMKTYFIEKLNHNYPLDWFDNEFKAMTSIDIYKHAFDYQKKYILIKNDNLNILIFRVDLSDERKEDLIKDFVGLDSFSLLSTNIGSEKDYGELYSKFKKQIQLPKAYIEQMLESKYAKHFYSEQERKDIYSKFIQ